MNPKLFSLLDLLRMAIIRCGSILQNPQRDSSGSFLIQVTPGPAPLLVEDPSVVRFLLAMQKEGIDLGFHLESKEGQSQQLVMSLRKQEAQVAVSVPSTAPAGGGTGKPFPAAALNLQAILTGLSRALVELRYSATDRPPSLQAGQARGLVLRQAMGFS